MKNINRRSSPIDIHRRVVHKQIIYQSSERPNVCLLTTLRCVYISIGPLRRLIYYLFVDYPPMNINWAAPTIDILNLDYPPIINVFRQPSEQFSLDSSHALTPIVLGCSSAYGMHVCHFQYSLITCKYVNMHIFT